MSRVLNVLIFSRRCHRVVVATTKANVVLQRGNDASDCCMVDLCHLFGLLYRRGHFTFVAIAFCGDTVAQHYTVRARDKYGLRNPTTLDIQAAGCIIGGQSHKAPGRRLRAYTQFLRLSFRQL